MYPYAGCSCEWLPCTTFQRKVQFRKPNHTEEGHKNQEVTGVCLVFLNAGRHLALLWLSTASELWLSPRHIHSIHSCAFWPDCEGLDIMGVSENAERKEQEERKGGRKKKRGGCYSLILRQLIQNWTETFMRMPLRSRFFHWIFHTSTIFYAMLSPSSLHYKCISR